MLIGATRCSVKCENTVLLNVSFLFALVYMHCRDESIVVASFFLLGAHSSMKSRVRASAKGEKPTIPVIRVVVNGRPQCILARNCRLFKMCVIVLHTDCFCHPRDINPEPAIHCNVCSLVRTFSDRRCPLNVKSTSPDTENHDKNGYGFHTTTRTSS